MPVTQEEVAWCYRSILGREPKSAEAVQRRVSSAKDFRALILTFIGSPEYKAKNSLPTSVPLDKGEMDLQTTATAGDLLSLKARVREVWSQLGLTCPYSVLTRKTHLPEVMNEDAIERFYAMGVKEVETIGAILRRHGFSDPESKICVEYGCGLGRVTLALAKMFKKVHGYDISPNHLALAKSRASGAGIRNVEFHLCSADLIIENLEDCDFFYSCLVFQHNPPPLIRELIVASLKSLREGGVAIFQVPTYRLGYSFRIKEYLATAQKLTMEMHCIPQQEVFSLIADAHCRVLEVRETVKGLPPRQWISNTFVVQRLANQRWRWKRSATRRQ